MLDYEEKRRKEIISVLLLIFGVIATVTVLFMYEFNKPLLDLIIYWIKMTSIFIGVCLVITTFIFIVLQIVKNRRYNEQQRVKIEKHLDCIQKMESLDKAEEEIDYLIKNRADLLPKRAFTIRDDILAKREQIAHAKQHRLRQQEKAEQLAEQKKQLRIEKLVTYFQQKKSTETIPDWAIQMSSNDVHSAIHTYHTDINEKEKDKRLRREIISFLIKHQEFPAHFQELSECEKSLYRHYKNMNLKELRSELGYPIGEAFYLANELEPEKRQELLEQGFRSVPLINPKTGKAGINCVIWNNEKKETDYHFCLKHWFAKTFDGEVEVLVDDQRVDFVINDVAFEIETGSNKDIQIKKKIEMLENNFTEWYIICSAKLQPRYARFAPKSKLLTLTQAYKKALELTEE